MSREQIERAAAEATDGHVEHFNAWFKNGRKVRHEDVGGIQCLCGWSAPHDERGLRPWSAYKEHVARAVIAAVEPLIRADEAAKVRAEWEQVRQQAEHALVLAINRADRLEEELAALRAEVGTPEEADELCAGCGERMPDDHWCSMRNLL